MSRYQDKAFDVFGDKVVDKAMASSAGLPRLPRYVVEWLVANHVKPDTEQQDLKALRERVAEVLPESDRREVIKEKLLSDGEVYCIDHLDVRVDLKTGNRVGTLTNLGITGIDVPKRMVDRIPKLLSGGAWGAIVLRYCTGAAKRGPFQYIQAYAMTAFQEAKSGLQELQAKRAAFDTEEWADLLLASVGYNPEHYPDWRTKVLLLTRLIPVVEANCNLIELGPRQTGKTYLLRNVASSCYTASGANVTAAGLFSNVSTGALGIIATYKVVVLDEIAHTCFDDISTVSMMKDYMESGQFARGGRIHCSDASIVMTGNIDVVGNEPSPKYCHLFEPLPRELQDTALLDRVHGYIPGWEIPVLKNDSIGQGYGLSVDYLGQALQELRGRDFRFMCRPLLDSVGRRLTRRDVVAIEKTSSGLIKLLYPNGVVPPDELHSLVQYCGELRGLVVSQLAVMSPGEFSQRARFA